MQENKLENKPENKLKIYNTLTRSVEEFVPINKKSIGIYTCGPTVYHFAHLGNMRAYIFADILNNTLHALYPDAEIKHVINITDVGHLTSDADDGEDKLEKGAKRENKTVFQIARFYEDSFKNDLRLLNVSEEKYNFPRATDYIKEQIEMIKSLEEKGYTYPTEDGIYFDTSKFPHYADFAKLNISGLESGKRVADENNQKKNITDFAVWKFSPTEAENKRQMEWDSPWGVGFPGWHVECSAMSESILGEHFDIHTGGIDHIPVHHTNEIAQSECAHDGEKYVNYWLHVNFLQIKSEEDENGVKMSKSEENFLRVQTLIDKNYNPCAYKYLLFTTSYRKELEFSFESLDAAATALKKLSRYMHEQAKNTENIIDATKYRINEEYYQKFIECLCDDINTSKAIALIWEMINSKESDKIHHVYSTILKINKILELDLSYTEEKIEYTPEALELIQERKLAREAKDWAKSDELREKIRGLGFEVID